MKQLFYGLLLAAIMTIPATAQRTISDLSPIVPDSVDDKTQILFGVDDTGAATSYNINIRNVGEVVTSHRITSTSHGRSASDEGKPLYDVAIYDDTDQTERPDWILTQYIDANTLRVGAPGTLMSIPVTLLEDGASYSIASSGRRVFWDASDARYEPVRPDDSFGGTLLTILSVGGSTFEAVFDPTGEIDDGYSVTIVGTGVAATDTAAFQAAAATLNAAGKGVIYVHGACVLNANISFTKAVSLIGIPGSGAKITSTDTVGNFRWNADYNPFTAGETSTAITATAARQSYIEVPTGTLTAGQWFFVLSDDDISGITAHTPGVPHRPMEMHQVKEIRTSSGGTDYVVFDDIIIDALTTSPRVIEPVNVLEDIRVEGIQFDWTGSTTPFAGVLDFRKCVNVVVRDCHFLHEGPNEISVMYCANVLIHNITMESKEAYDTGDGYGVITGVTTGFVFSDSVVYGHRHVYSTTAHCYNPGGVTDCTPPIVVGTARYGTTRNAIIDSVVAKQNGDATSSLVSFDTHAEGYGIVFQNCTAIAPYDPRSFDPLGTKNTNRGFQTRSRATVFRNCSVIGEGLIGGFLVLAEDCHLENCLVDGAWRGIWIKHDTSGGLTDSVDGATIVNCRIKNTSSSDGAITIDDGDEHVISKCVFDGALNGVWVETATDRPDNVRIDHCTFKDCTSAGVNFRNGIGHSIFSCAFDNCGTSGDQSCVFMAVDTTAKIDNCEMAKETNEFSVGGTSIDSGDVVMTGCNLRDYTGDADSENTGFDVLGAASATLHSENSGFNWVTP